MWRPNNIQWWIFFAVTLFVVVAWPPQEDKSLAIKFVNWGVDPNDQLPVLPPQLSLGMSDDPEAVNTRDAQVRQYDALYAQGGWTRKRLQMKVADDPFDASTTRQLLIVLAVVVGLLVWRINPRRR